MSFKFFLLFAFLTIQASCEEKGSLAFIIDDTGSSFDNMKTVKSAATMILNMTQTSAQIDDIVVVTFNDPVVALRTRTNDARVFKEAIDSITVQGGYDCPEMSLSGIMMGLQETRPGSNLYVFTDASAKDHHRFEEVKALCQEKKSQITFILTGTCNNNNTPQMDEVYNNIAVACGGAVLRISNNQFAEVYRYVQEYMNVAKNAMTPAKLSPFTWTTTKFTKDASTDYVLVVGSGTDIELQVLNEEGKVIERSLGARDNFKILTLTDLPNGQFFVKARSSSSGHVTIYAHTKATDNEGTDADN